MFLCFNVAMTSISFSKSSRAETSIPDIRGSLKFLQEVTEGKLSFEHENMHFAVLRKLVLS